MNEEPSRTVPTATPYDHSASLNVEDVPEANFPDKVPDSPVNAGQLSGGGSVESRLKKLEQKMAADLAKREAAAKAIAEFNASQVTDDGPLEEGWCWTVVKVIQYIIGFTLSLYGLFITFYGLSNGYSKSSPCSENMKRLHTKYDQLAGDCEAGDFHEVLVIFFLILLLTVLAFCEGTQIALMLLEKVRPRDIKKDIYCYNRVRRTHELAQNNTERYLLGRQIFVTGIVFLVAKLIGMKPSYAFAVSDTTCAQVNGRPDPTCDTDVGLLSATYKANLNNLTTGTNDTSDQDILKAQAKRRPRRQRGAQRIISGLEPTDSAQIDQPTSDAAVDYSV